MNLAPRKLDACEVQNIGGVLHVAWRIPGIDVRGDLHIAMTQVLRDLFHRHASADHVNRSRVAQGVDRDAIQPGAGAGVVEPLADILDAAPAIFDHIISQCRFLGRCQRGTGHAVHRHNGPALAGGAVWQAQVDHPAFKIHAVPFEVEDSANAPGSAKHEDNGKPDMRCSRGVNELGDFAMGQEPFFGRGL